MYGPQAAFIAELFSTKLRYSGASMGYQIAGSARRRDRAAGLDRPVSATRHAVRGVGLRAAMMVLTLVALAVAPETAWIDLHDEPAAAQDRAGRG